MKSSNDAREACRRGAAVLTLFPRHRPRRRRHLAWVAGSSRAGERFWPFAAAPAAGRRLARDLIGADRWEDVWAAGLRRHRRRNNPHDPSAPARPQGLAQRTRCIGPAVRSLPRARCCRDRWPSSRTSTTMTPMRLAASGACWRRAPFATWPCSTRRQAAAARSCYPCPRPGCARVARRRDALRASPASDRLPG
jgi:hypothetical protein